ncbi:hypothetical protein N9273_00455 [bacterium]|nr:hypothetical protein [bacterium]
MKKLILPLFLVTASLHANNEIYLDQSGGSGTFTIKQDGSTNNFGSVSDRAELTGDSKIFTAITTGTANEIYIRETGNSTTTELLITGNNNKFDSKVDGDSNQTIFEVSGNDNDIIVKADVDADIDNTTSNTIVDVTVAGNSNDVVFSMVDTDSIFNSWNLIGDMNSINSYQQGQTGGIGHSQVVDIFGSSNNVDIYQVGLESNSIDLFVIGSDNNYTITQTDGTAPTYSNTPAVTNP